MTIILDETICHRHNGLRLDPNGKCLFCNLQDEVDRAFIAMVGKMIDSNMHDSHKERD